MERDILQGRWKQMRGEVRKWWGKLTDDEVDRIAGSNEKLVGILQERYGYTKQKALQEVSEFLDMMENRLAERSR